MAKFWVYRVVNHVVGTIQYRKKEHSEQVDKFEKDRARGHVIDFDLITAGTRGSAITKFRKLERKG